LNSKSHLNTEYLNKVFFKDSRQMIELPDNSIDMILTSPPYFNIKDYSKNGYQTKHVGKKYKSQIGDIEDYDKYIYELLIVWKECERVLNPNGKLIINTPLMPMLKENFNTHYNRHIFNINGDIENSILKNTKLFLYDLFIWNRTNPSKRLMFGSYPYPRNFYAQNTIEFINIFVKDGIPANNLSVEIKERSKLTEKDWMEYTKQIWNIPVPNKRDIAFGKHSAIMPEEIVRRCVKLFTFESDLVLDPFAGSGTTLKVAKELNRNYVGYEISESYEKLISAKLMLQNNKIYNLDCIIFLNQVERNSVDLAVIDPPYNMRKADWDTFKSHSDFLKFTFSWIDALIPTLKETGSLYIFNTPFNCAYILQYLVDKGLVFQNWITWDKKDGLGSSKTKYSNGQETILFFTRSNKHTFNYNDIRVPYESADRIKHAALKGIPKNGRRWFPNPAGRFCGEVWHIVSERHKNKVNGKTVKNEHVASKPLELIERIIKASSNEGDLVLDCFAGSGTTAVASKKLSRNFICSDSDEKYVNLSRKKLETDCGLF